VTLSAAAFLFALLLIGHAVADSLLQPPWLSIRKRDTDRSIRLTALALHGTAHALPVALVTGRPELAIAELILHPLIDDLKARSYYGLAVDQILHVACKAAWIAAMVWL
jgi:hypothetical protein